MKVKDKSEDVIDVSAIIQKNLDQVLDLLIEEKKHNKLTPLINEDEYRKEVIGVIGNETQRVSEEFGRRLKHGITLILNNLKYNHHALERFAKELQVVESLIHNNGSEITVNVPLGGQHEDGLIPISSETLNEFYNAALHFHEHNEFEKAADAFYFLCVIKPMIPNVWMGYGHSQQSLKRYESALYAYAIATLLDINNPKPHYFSALCYENLHEHHNAINSLDLALACHNSSLEAVETKNAANQLLRKIAK